jgi:DNA-binding CsgD family transcriptional regulator
MLVKNMIRDGANSAAAETPGLTAREREVLQLLAEGKTSKQIAMIHQVSVKTVEVHRQRIMKKLGIHNIAQLTKYAIREGLTAL